MTRRYSARIGFCTTAILMGLSMLTSTLRAQEANESGAETSLETIVVTAQKRSENLQDVPISVSVMSGKALEDMKVTNLVDLASVIPNVQLNYLNLTPNAATYMIRGIGTADQDGYVGSAVSVVVDGVPQIFNAGNKVELFDLDRIEILRGPQGTLFGANSTGGVVNIVTAGPADDYEGNAIVTVGNFNRIDEGAAVSIPLSDTMKSKIVAFQTSSDGYMHNVATADEANPGGSWMGGYDHTVLRGYLKFEPSSDFDAMLTTEYDRERNGSAAIVEGASPGELFYVAPGVDNMYQNPCPVPNQQCHATGQWDSANNGPDSDDTNTYRATVTINARNTAVGDITAITGYRDYNYFEYGDLDGTPEELAERRAIENQWQLSQELRDSFKINSEINSLLGAFFISDRYQNHLDLLLPAYGPGLDSNANQMQTDWAASLFSQTYVNVTDRLRLQAGIRYTHEYKKMTASNFLTVNKPGADPFNTEGSTPVSSVPWTTASDSWNNLGWKLDLDYKLDNGMLLYGYWARGFKSGGFVGRIALPTDIGPYKPETVDTFELGFKGDMLNNRLRTNVAIFDTEYKDQQVPQTYTYDDAGVLIIGSTVANAAKSRIYGAEFEGTAILTDAFVLDTSLSYLHANFLDFPYVDPITLAHLNLGGQQLQNAPNWMGTLGGTYTMAVGGGSLATHMAYRYTSTKYLQCVIDTPDCKIQATSLVDANVDWQPANSRWTVSLWANNLFDRQYLAMVYINPGIGRAVSYDPPREWGATIKYKF